jgi:hypothetical protein
VNAPIGDEIQWPITNRSPDANPTLDTTPRSSKRR